MKIMRNLNVVFDFGIVEKKISYINMKINNKL